MDEPSTLKPFHESVVDAINRADVAAMHTLAGLIRETKIPKGHDEIIDAWNNKMLELQLRSDLEVPDSVMAQKPVETAGADA